MVAGQVVGMESFFEGNLGGLEEEGKGRREACTRFNPRPGGGGGSRWRRDEGSRTVMRETRQGASLHWGCASLL